MRDVRRLVAGLALAAVLSASAALAQPDPNQSSASINQPATLMVLPSGTGPALPAGTVITVQVIDVTGLPMNGLVAGDIEVDGFPPATFGDGFLPPATWDVTAAGFAAGPGPGQYRLTGPLVAGGWATAALVKVRGVQIQGAPLPLSMNSPDINGDGIVDLADVGFFASDLFGVYNFRSDFRPDGIINISDVGFMAASLGQAFPPGYVVDPVD